MESFVVKFSKYLFKVLLNFLNFDMALMVIIDFKGNIPHLSYINAQLKSGLILSLSKVEFYRMKVDKFPR